MVKATAAQPAPGTPETERGAPADILDFGHLARYTMDDPALESELLELFRHQLRLQTEKIESATSAEQWKIATHSLKGAARSIGAARIARIAKDLEALGCDGDPLQREALVESLHREVAACERVIAARTTASR